MRIASILVTAASCRVRGPAARDRGADLLHDVPREGRAARDAAGGAGRRRAHGGLRGPGPASSARSGSRRLRAPARSRHLPRLSPPADMQDALETARAAAIASRSPGDASLELLLAGAFVRNPGLEAAAEAAVRDRGAVRAGDVPRQHPAAVRLVPAQLEDGGGPGPARDALATRFPFPGTLELKAALVGHAVEEARARTRSCCGDLVTDVRVAFAKLRVRRRSRSRTLGRPCATCASSRRPRAACSRRDAPGRRTSSRPRSRSPSWGTTSSRSSDSRTRCAPGSGTPSWTCRPPRRSATRRPSPMPPLPDDLVALQARALHAQPEILAATARAARMAAMIELAEQTTYPALSPGPQRHGGRSRTRRAAARRNASRSRRRRASGRIPGSAARRRTFARHARARARRDWRSRPRRTARPSGSRRPTTSSRPRSASTSSTATCSSPRPGRPTTTRRRATPPTASEFMSRHRRPASVAPLPARRRSRGS